MTYLLDTCILSKMRKLRIDPNPQLQNWISSHPENSYYLSVITLGEIQLGIAKLDSQSGKKRILLENWLLGDLVPRFKGRILNFDFHTASIWGSMKGEAQRRGHNLAVVDSLIAATAIQHNLILVTENIKDFAHTGAKLFNPLAK